MSSSQELMLEIENSNYASILSFPKLLIIARSNANWARGGSLELQNFLSASASLLNATKGQITFSKQSNEEVTIFLNETIALGVYSTWMK